MRPARDVSGSGIVAVVATMGDRAQEQVLHGVGRLIAKGGVERTLVITGGMELLHGGVIVVAFAVHVKDDDVERHAYRLVIVLGERRGRTRLLAVDLRVRRNRHIDGNRLVVRRGNRLFLGLARLPQLGHGGLGRKRGLDLLARCSGYAQRLLEAHRCAPRAALGKRCGFRGARTDRFLGTASKRDALRGVLIADVKCRGNELLLSLGIYKGIARRVLGRTVKLVHAVELLNSKVIERNAKAIEIVLVGAAKLVHARDGGIDDVLLSFILRQAIKRHICAEIFAGQLVADAVGDIVGQALIDRIEAFRRCQTTLLRLVSAVGMLTVAARKRIVQIDVMTFAKVFLKALAGVVPVQKVLGVVASAIAKDVVGKRRPVGQYLFNGSGVERDVVVHRGTTLELAVVDIHEGAVAIVDRNGERVDHVTIELVARFILKGKTGCRHPAKRRDRNDSPTQA